MVAEQIQRRGVRDERVLSAMRKVPRHEFVPQDLRAQAYEDHPVAIMEEQTVSQPFMVASMIENAELKPADVVLEVGTGSGYQAAVLAELAKDIFTIERFSSLAESAQRLLARLGYANVTVAQGDGSAGLPQYAPYDAIIVAAAAPSTPQALVEQLREGGRLVIPVGDSEDQELLLIRKTNGEAVLHRLYKCKFVPLIGEHGF